MRRLVKIRMYTGHNYLKQGRIRFENNTMICEPSESIYYPDLRHNLDETGRSYLDFQYYEK